MGVLLKKKPGFLRTLVALLIATVIAVPLVYKVNAAFIFGFIALILIMFGYAVAQFYWLQKYSVQQENNRLLLKGKSGKIVSEIDLNEDYEIQYGYEGFMWAVYVVRQKSRRLKFSSKSLGAEQVVRDVLHLDWPPTGRTPSPGV